MRKRSEIKQSRESAISKQNGNTKCWCINKKLPNLYIQCTSKVAEVRINMNGMLANII